MIVVVGALRTDAEHRERLMEIGQTVARASREEAGCLRYALYADSEDENAFVFVEQWEDEEALRRHFTTPHLAELLRALPETLVEEPVVRFHTVASTATMADYTS